jgi:hypothetical protein
MSRGRRDRSNKAGDHLAQSFIVHGEIVAAKQEKFTYKVMTRAVESRHLILLSTIFFVKNFFRGLVKELSSIEVAATSASDVSLNFPKAFSLILNEKSLSGDSSLLQLNYLNRTIY